MSYPTRLYQVLYPNRALIASQLEPDAFSRHYQLRSRPQDAGKLIFAGIDISFRHDYFRIDDAFASVVPHDDGSPKHTKFISSYRVLEHMDLSCIERLYLANPDGSILSLDRVQDEERASERALTIFAEICPLSILVLTRYTARKFGDIITDPAYSKGTPKLFFAVVDLDIPAFLEEFEKNPFIQAPIASLHPSKLRDAVRELQNSTTKKMKGLCLTSSLDDISYKMIRPGFWFVSAMKSVFFKMPAAADIERLSYRFWRSM